MQKSLTYSMLRFSFDLSDKGMGPGVFKDGTLNTVKDCLGTEIQLLLKPDGIGSGSPNDES